LFPPLRELIQRDATEAEQLQLEGGDWVGHLRKIIDSRIENWNQGNESHIAEADWLLALCWENAVSTEAETSETPGSPGFVVDRDFVAARSLLEAAAERGYKNA